MRTNRCVSVRGLLFALCLCVMGSGVVRAEDTAGAEGRVLILLDRGFNRQEFFQIYFALRGMGYPTDIVAPERGPVFLSNDSVPDARNRDAVANLALDEIDDISAYLGFVIIGGYAPGYLEKYPKALEIVQAFMDAEVPVAAICHGPRLLMRIGALVNRPMACWHEVANELPDVWNSPARGWYIDEPVVRDGNLLTSRYPNDTAAQLDVFLQMLADAGGRPLPEKAGSVLVLAPAPDEGHVRWCWTVTLRTFGNTAHVLDNPDQLKRHFGENLDAIPEGLTGVIYVESPELDAWWAGDASGLPALLKGAGIPTLTVTSPAGLLGYADPVQAMVAFAAEHGRPLPVAAKPAPYTAAIALSDGFDEAVVATMRAVLEARGNRVALIASRVGWIRGLNGMPVEAGYTYDAPPELADGAILVAPGGQWPEHQPDARQAEIPDWIADQAVRDATRITWLLNQYEAGHTLLLFGFDSLRVGRNEQFKGMRFATTDQAVWSFGREGGRYAKEEVKRTGPRLITVRGAAALPQVIRELESLLVEPDPVSTENADEE